MEGVSPLVTMAFSTPICDLHVSFPSSLYLCVQACMCVCVCHVNVVVYVHLYKESKGQLQA